LIELIGLKHIIVITLISSIILTIKKMKIMNPKLKTMNRTAIIILLLISLGLSSKAQYEQKFTLQGSVGYVSVLSPASFRYQCFDKGFSLDAGVQYNFNRKFSIAGLVKYSRLLSPVAQEGIIVNSEYNLIGLSVCPKFRLFTRYRLNPYIYGGASLNYVDMSWENEYGSIESIKSNASFGVNGGLGADIRINDNLSLFLQGGLMTDKYDLPSDFFGTNEYWDWINFTYFQAGINISLFKSKSL